MDLITLHSAHLNLKYLFKTYKLIDWILIYKYQNTPNKYTLSKYEIINVCSHLKK